PTQDTIYTQTNIPAFELSVMNGENLVWGKEPGKNVVRMDIYNLNEYGSPIIQEYLAGTVFNSLESLPKGRYRADFYLMTVGTQADTYDYVTTLAGATITTGVNFTISYADPEFRMKNPARDTVYNETNTPTFEVSVTNGESFIWGKKRGNKVMKVELYTEEAYNNPQGQPRQFFVENTTFTMPQALPQGKYHAVFTLMSVGAQADNYDFVFTLAGEKVSAETGFTIAYGTTNDTMLVMKNPANDTVYNATNKPAFAVSVMNGKDLVWGTTAGKTVVKMQVYTEAAYNAKGEPFVQEYVADTVFALPQLLPKGEYRAVFNLMSVAEQEGYNYLYNASGEIKTSVKFTINYGDIHNPALTLLNPAQDTVYTETTTPTFVLSLDKGGHDISLSRGAGNAAIRIEIFKAGATESLLEEFFVSTTYKLADVNALDTGNYNVRFTLMQWVNGSMQPNYWPATERVTTQVNIRIAKSEKPEPVAMVAPTDLSTRTHQDTVWFSWTSKEKVYQLQVTDAFGERVQNLKEDASSEDTVTTVWVSEFAEGTYKWQLRAVAVSEGAVVDSSDWVEGEKFTVKYETPDLSVEDNILAEVNVYPNPTTGEFKVNVPVDAVVEIYAANGHRVAARRVVAGTETFALETSGMYFVRVTANGKTAVRRIVVR
ncbi:MAG: T9SS type A sorting domain-containing protein, partial [Bacteroidales bacterium]|nr:T9SS type A sorting domain-containing protein [Bacteroidales bacterium]